MEKYPSIGFILDVHRDALEDKAGHQYKVVTREDPDCAQVSLVMGSSWEGWAGEPEIRRGGAAAPDGALSHADAAADAAEFGLQ